MKPTLDDHERATRADLEQVVRFKARKGYGPWVAFKIVGAPGHEMAVKAAELKERLERELAEGKWSRMVECAAYVRVRERQG